MSLLTEIFAAADEDALQYESLKESSAQPTGRFAGLRFGGLTNLPFEVLWALAQQQAWSPNVHKLEQLSLADDGEHWLFRFPRAFVVAMAGWTATDLERLAQAWASTAEMACSPAEVQPILQGLVRLSGRAVAESRGLFLCGSL